MAATYKVWVANLVSLGTTIYDGPRGSYYYEWNQATLDKVVEVLKGYFNDVCKHPTSKFGSTDVDASKDLNAIGTSKGSTDVVVRITTKANSAVIQKYGKQGTSADTGGVTIDTGSGVVSEVWLESAAGDANVAKLLARTAFHELMHNKIDATVSSKDIHGKDDGTGLATATGSANDQLTSQNKINMASKLSSVVNQFTGATIP